MKIVIAGSSGMIGTPLVRALRADGHEVTRLVRRDAAAPDEVSWDPAAGSLDASALSGVDAAINLAGVNAGDAIHWTESFKAKFRASRVDSTRTLSEALAKIDPGPRVLLNASAIGYYGDTRDRPIEESDPAGSDSSPRPARSGKRRRRQRRMRASGFVGSAVGSSCRAAAGFSNAASPSSA